MKLFDRFEQRFECDYNILKKFENKILEINGFKKEIFFGKTDSEFVATLALIDLKNLNFTHYSRIRIRKYFLKNVTEIRPLFVEAIIRSGSKTVKHRWNLSTEKFNELIKSLSSPPLLFIVYKRKAFNNEKLGVRITIDTEIKYYNLPKNLSSFRFGKLIGQEKVALVKIKSVSKLPKQVLVLTKFLRKPRISKLKRAIMFLKKVKE